MAGPASSALWGPRSLHKCPVLVSIAYSEPQALPQSWRWTLQEHPAELKFGATKTASLASGQPSDDHMCPADMPATKTPCWPWVWDEIFSELPTKKLHHSPDFVSI